MAVQGPKHPRRCTFSNPGDRPSCGNRCSLNPPNRRIRTRMSGGVGGGGREADPYPDLDSHMVRHPDFYPWTPPDSTCDWPRLVRGFFGVPSMIDSLEVKVLHPA